MSAAKIIKFERRDTPPPAEVKRMDSGFIQIPNDVFRAAKRVLRGNDYKVACEVMDKTYGYNKAEDDMTIQQIADGIGIDRGNASRAYNRLVKMGVIYSRKGKFGFITGFNPVEKWACENNTTVSNSHGKNNTTVSKQHASPCQINTHNIQLPKYINIYSSTQDENQDAENPTLAIADAMAADRTGEDADCPAPQTEGKKSKQAADNRKRFEAIAGEFNRVFADCQGVRKVNLAATQTNAKRMRLIPKAWAIAKQRIAAWADENGLIEGETPSGKHCVEWFGLYFEQCRQDPFVTGEGGRSKGHENWKPGFEYLLRAEVMEARVLEGA